jgi:Ca-activated chloride channel family protein
MTFRFLHPEMAVWLLAVPIAAAAWLLYYVYKYRSRKRAGVQPRFLELSRPSTTRRDLAILLLAIAAVGLLVTSVTGPQLLRERRAPEYERQDLVIMLDRSVSMRARDIRPSRAERALAELKNFLRQKPEAIDRVGLVGFSNTSLVLSYLTRDVDALLFYLDWIGDDPGVLYGTDMGAALESALDVVRRDTQPTRKLFLVISDGDDQGETLEKAVLAVKQQDIRVHTIGIGTAQESLITVRLPGQPETLLRDDAGRPIVTEFSEATLRWLASETGGRYVRSVTGSEMLDALDQIARANRRQVGWQTTNEYRDIHMFLLAAAAVAAAFLVALL